MSFPVPFFLWPLTAGFYAGGLLFHLVRKERIALVLLFVGFVANTLYLIGRGGSFGIFTPLNMVTETYFLPWCLVLLAGLLGFIEKDKKIAISGIPLIFFFGLMALVIPVDVNPPNPQHETVFASLFFLTEVLAHACFIAGGWFALLGMVGPREMPIFHKLIVWGFVLYSLAQVVGAVWAYLGWGAPFNWSDRHLQSTALWCFYAAYLHLHFSAKWSLKKKTCFAVIGPVFVTLFSFSYYFR